MSEAACHSHLDHHTTSFACPSQMIALKGVKDVRDVVRWVCVEGSLQEYIHGGGFTYLYGVIISGFRKRSLALWLAGVMVSV